MLFGPALHSDLRSVAAFAFGNSKGPNPGFRPDLTPESARILTLCRRRRSLGVRASSNGAAVEKSKDNRFSICTADEVHFVKAPNSDWSLALWRYLPYPEMEYIRAHCKSKDGKLHAIGHSMGGILLYAMISRCCSEEKDCGLASVTTLASSLDYTSSRSSLKLLLPLADPAQALNVPGIPIGAIISAIHPLASHPPYLLSWLKSQISSQEMMRQELYEKVVLNYFCTVPAKLLLQLASAFQKGGLRDRSGNFFYKDHLHKTNVPILAIGGDQDLICPPEAVYETAKLIPEHMLTLKILGEPEGPHYAHYDVVGSHLAADQVYPHIIEFLNHNDMT
ncbi:uncharacterized protein LOC133830920 [Humulus lupulus]|uniref:uncharacterized protein LOC133830920 n=1 Tax=Humulus lupulus TaxID=3486 RepID=UPI002B40B196|nr:uncharacterized protein LOC133830920 [Humulus lupulus]